MPSITTTAHAKPDTFSEGSLVATREWNRITGQYDGDVIVGIVTGFFVVSGKVQVCVSQLRDGGISVMESGVSHSMPVGRVQRVEVTSHKIDSYTVKRFAPRKVG